MNRTYPEGVTSWIDVEQPDLAAARAFYSELFGWSFVESGGDAAYVIAQLDGQDVAGLAHGRDPKAVDWNTYIAVDDLDRAVSRVEAARGRVTRPPTPAAAAGRMAACVDSQGVPFRLWEAGGRLGAQVTNAPGAWNFSDLHAADPAGSAAFYADVFGWQIDDVGFGAMIRQPGYGDHLAATVDPGIHERQEGVQAPPGFADAIGWLVPAEVDERPQWHVTFSVADRDDTVAIVERLGGAVLTAEDTEWTRHAVVRDPQGAAFTVSQFAPTQDDPS